MSNLLQSKVVVVTGAASGIGRAIAIGAARHGAKAVVVSDVIESPREGGEPRRPRLCNWALPPNSC